MMGEMVSLEAALAIVADHARQRAVGEEEILAAEAAGRVLAADAIAGLTLPPFDKSAMDGYAVLANDERDSYQVVERVAAGRVPTRPLAPGCATKVMTGAPVPAGAGKVIMVEDTDQGAEIVRVHRHRGKANICRQGEDVRPGDVVLRAGTRLDAVRIAALLSCAVTRLRVRRQVRVAILVTGDELVDASQEIRPGCIVDSNGPMLAGLARGRGREVVLQRRVADTAADTIAALAEARKLADLVLLSGGVSEGDYDFVPAAMRETGFAIRFDRVATKPGKPVTFATADDCLAVGLPGNPVSVFVGFHLYCVPLLAWLGGVQPGEACFSVSLRDAFSQRSADRASFLPCRLDAEGCAVAVEYHGSAHLGALAQAQGFLLVPAGVRQLAAGARVKFFPWRMTGDL